MKKITALIISLIMLLSYSAPAFAETVNMIEETALTEETITLDEENEASEEGNTETPGEKEEINSEEETVNSEKSEKKEVLEETTETEKKETTVKGLKEKKTVKATSTLKDTLIISPAGDRTVHLQMYDEKEKKWTDKITVNTNPSKENTVLTYPEDWKKTNRSKWRIVIDENDEALSYKSPVLTVDTRNRSKVSVSAKSVLIMKEGNGQILYSKNMNKKRQIASTTKLMTAVVSVEHKKLSSKARISKKASKTPYSIKLKKGDRFKLKALMQAMLIASDNACANAVAENSAKSRKKFIKLMNSKAKALGMTNSHFANANGLPNKKNYSTAYDLALLTRYAMKKKSLVKIMRKKKVTIKTLNKKKKFKIRRTNMLLGFKGLIAGKTGWTNAAGGCYTCEYSYKGEKYVIVVLGSKNTSTRFSDAKKLIKYINKYC